MTQKGQKRLLDAAGYPRGADGIRFKTVYEHFNRGDFDLDYYQIVMEYLRAIGIDVEVKLLPTTEWLIYYKRASGKRSEYRTCTTPTISPH